MNFQEAKYILTIIRNGWRYRNFDDMDVQVFAEMLDGHDFETIASYVKSRVGVDEEAPNVGSILAALNGTTKTTESEVWEMLQKCVARFGSYRLPRSIGDLNYHNMQVEAEQLGVPADVFDFGTRFGWMELCVSENPDVMRGHVCRAWRDEDPNTLRRHEVEREENLALLVSHTKELDSGIVSIENREKNENDSAQNIRAIIAQARASI